MGAFSDWMQVTEMAVKTATRWGEPIGNLDTKDGIGLKHMARPGFRNPDRDKILKDSPEVERKLTKATEQYGIHWVIGYLEPEAGTEEDDPDHWDRYNAQAKADGAAILGQFSKEYQGGGAVPIEPPDPNNTIVYVKPTSRAHTLSPHEQVHNIGHALWLTNPGLLKRAKEELHKAVAVLQQSAHEADPSAPPPTEAEVTIILARLIDLTMYQRALVLNPGDLSSPAKTALTAFNSFDEVMFDLIPAFVNAGGRINLYPRPAGKTAKFDRTAAIPPNQEVISQKGVRPWVWEKMASDRQAWAQVSAILTGIVVECLRASTFAKVGGPIYPHKITTKA